MHAAAQELENWVSQYFSQTGLTSRVCEGEGHPEEQAEGWAGTGMRPRRRVQENGRNVHVWMDDEREPRWRKGNGGLCSPTKQRATIPGEEGSELCLRLVSCVNVGKLSTAVYGDRL